MIHGILDNDFYKYTMMAAVISLFPKEIVRYKFINRGNTIFPDGFAKELKNEIEDLKFITEGEFTGKSYLKSIRFLSPFFIDYISHYQFDPNEVKIEQIGGKLDITIEGIPGVNPLNIVIKMDSVFINGEWIPTIKLSDEPGKYTGDKDTIVLAKKVLNL